MAEKTRFAVLGVLSIEASSGYDIRKFLEMSVGHFWRESFGQIYPVLKALEAEGAVSAHEQPHGGRKRRIYTIEQRGRDELRAWIKAPATGHRADRNELLLKLFFCDPESQPVLLDRIRNLRAAYHRELTEFRHIETELAPDRSHPSYPYWIATLRYGQLSAEATIEWCNQTLRSFGTS